MPHVGQGFGLPAGFRALRASVAPRHPRIVTDNGVVLEMTRETFEELVSRALDRIPPELTRVMDNVAVFVEDEPPADDPDAE